jgi:hypothetical protein
MNTKIENIEVDINGKACYVSLCWMRAASRYNNGGNNGVTLLKDRYPLRLILGRLKDHLNNRVA